MKESEILAVVQRSLFEAWRNWGATARPLAAATFIAVIGVAAACALGMVG
jgi:predicted membrane protein